MPNGNYTPSVLVDTSNLTRDEWLDWRRKGIGGSDAAAVIGVSPYSTARDLYGLFSEKENSDFKYLTRKLCTDTEIGFFTADNIAGRTRKYRYNYKAFYAAAGNSTFDIFKCSENGKLYVPGAFELFCYMEDN